MDTNDQIKVEVNDINIEDGQVLTVQPASKALSDGSRAESPSPNYKQHTWTVEQRLTLVLLGEYKNNWKDKTAVFNQFHKSDLRRRGGLRKAVVNTQYNDMRKNFDPADALKRLQATLSPYERLKLVSRAALERKANEIGIRLNSKRPADSSRLSRIFDKHDAQRHKLKRADPIDEERTDYFSNRSHNGSQTPSHIQTTHELRPLAPPKTPTKIYGQKPNNGLLTPPDSGARKLQRLTADKHLAPIGFRAFTPQSQGKYSSALGIRAGAFLDCPTIPLARDLDVTTYRNEALHHVTKHDHSHPSKFVSATKNPMRAFHMALKGGEGSTLAVINLHEADKYGNVQKGYELKLETEFRYTAAGEYLIFGGVEPEAIISHIPLSKLIANMPVTAFCDDPFGLKILQAEEKLSYARRVIKKGAHPMTYSLGIAVGNLVGVLGIPPKHFECSVWAIWQDYKFYSAEGGTRKGPWSKNTAFRDGVLQGYQAYSGLLATLGNQEGRTYLEVQTWVQNTQVATRSPQRFDLDTRKWTIQDEDLSDDFLAELKEMADTANVDSPRIDGDKMIEDAVYVSDINPQEEAGNMAFYGLEIDTVTVIEGGLDVPSSDSPKDLENIHKLCIDLLGMHGEANAPRLAVKDVDYGYCWTGM